MKKLLVLLLILPIVFFTSCKKEPIPVEDIYGKYDYKDCIYINDMLDSSTVAQNKLYKNIARYSLTEKIYSFYASTSNTPTMNIIGVKYVENEVLENISYKPVVKLLKKATTRYDVYKGDNSQGYSFVFSEDKAFFLEFRYFQSSQSHVLMKVVEIEKRN